jgi:hypothetical protein
MARPQRGKQSFGCTGAMVFLICSCGVIYALGDTVQTFLRCTQDKTDCISIGTIALIAISLGVVITIFVLRDLSWRQQYDNEETRREAGVEEALRKIHNEQS